MWCHREWSIGLLACPCANAATSFHSLQNFFLRHWLPDRRTTSTTCLAANICPSEKPTPSKEAASCLDGRCWSVCVRHLLSPHPINWQRFSIVWLSRFSHFHDFSGRMFYGCGEASPPLDSYIRIGLGVLVCHQSFRSLVCNKGWHNYGVKRAAALVHCCSLSI